MIGPRAARLEDRRPCLGFPPLDGVEEPAIRPRWRFGLVWGERLWFHTPGWVGEMGTVDYADVGLGAAHQ